MELNDRVYMELRPQERLRATIAALARGDEAEEDRLIATCQRKSYAMHDAQFSMPLKGIMAISAMHHLLLARQVINYIVANSALAKGGDEEDPRHEAAAQLVNVAASNVKARQEAWSEFCARARLEPADLTAMLGIGLESDPMIATTLEHMLDEDVEADAKTREQYLTTLSDAWEDLQCRN